MGIFDAIGIDAGIVLIIVILIQLVLIFFLVKQSMKLARLANKYKMFMRGKDAISLEKAFEKKFEEVDAITEAVKYQADEIYKLKEIQKMTLNKTAIVKYDAFKDVGGKLSFALAMLDKENSGFVLNAIHSREGCYTYVKEIVKGESYIVLGEEEKEALNKHIEEVKEAAKGDNIDDIKAKTAELEKISGEVFTKLYQQTAGAGTAESSEGVKVEDMGDNNN